MPDGRTQVTNDFIEVISKTPKLDPTQLNDADLIARPSVNNTRENEI